jgi:hypothetical protein
MRRLLMTSLALAALACAGSAGAQDARVKVGTLSCNEASGWAFVFGASHAVHCTFSNGQTTEYYNGHIDKYGVDIGYQHSGVLVWAVLAPTDHTNPGALKGHYGGLTAQATVGVGAGANALIGGNNRTIVLQPISVEGLTGLNVAAGIGALSLTQRPHR